MPTIKVVSDVPETGGYIVINAEDFDAEIHVEYVEYVEPVEKPAKTK